MTVIILPGRSDDHPTGDQIAAHLPEERARLVGEARSQAVLLPVAAAGGSQMSTASGADEGEQ